VSDGDMMTAPVFEKARCKYIRLVHKYGLEEAAKRLKKPELQMLVLDDLYGSLPTLHEEWFKREGFKDYKVTTKIPDEIITVSSEGEEDHRYLGPGIKVLWQGKAKSIKDAVAKYERTLICGDKL